MPESRRLPEQDPFHKSDVLSGEFRRIIDGIITYDGILLEDGKTVEMAFLAERGYDSKIPLDSFLNGVMYTQAIDKGFTLHVTKGLREGIEEKIDNIFARERRHCVVEEYSYGIEELKNILKTDFIKY